MKKSVILLSLIALFSMGYGQPRVSGLSYPSHVNVFDLYEISFSLGNYSNPYDPRVIDVYADFVGPDNNVCRVNGFYYESYSFKKVKNREEAEAGIDKGWRIRFTPDKAGTWSFVIHAIDSMGSVQATKQPVTFRCDAIDSTTGFISVANKRYLKREAVENGLHKESPFYPIGFNVAWYDYEASKTKPKGIYEYERIIDAIAGSANYMRIWLNRYQCLNLYGPEYTQQQGKNPIVYFDSKLNQKDAAELDHIISYAARNGINISPCIFSYGDFCNKSKDSSKWDNNPFHTILGLKSWTSFFTNKDAKRISKNLIRYIVARWSYATNIVCWELWNEVDNIPCESLSQAQFNRNIVDWHNEMASYIRSIDPYKHPITTSNASSKTTDDLYKQLYASLDFVQIHTYGNIQKAKSKEEQCLNLLYKSNDAHTLYPDKPCFIEEFGFGQATSKVKYKDKDPNGIDIHNSLWASLFSSSTGPAAFWYWDHLDKQGLLRIYEPILQYSKNLPLLSDSFKAYNTAKTSKNSAIYPNGIQTFYLANITEDSIFGWCQDTAFSYQALRRLADKVTKGHFDTLGKSNVNAYVYTLDAKKKPKPSSQSNTIILPIANQPAGTIYTIKWYDGETGNEIVSERTTVAVKSDIRNGKHLAFEFPASIRDLKKKTINNALGDAAFILYLQQDINKNGDTQSDDAANIRKRRINFIRRLKH